MASDRRYTEALSHADAAWLHMEDPTNLMVVAGLLMFDEPLDMARVRDMLRQRLLSYPRFRQRVVEPLLPWSSPYWEYDQRFDITAHLHRIALPAPGDQAALQDLLGDLISMPLDYTKPLWQCYVIEGYGDGCAVLIRLHHCIADGIALAQVLLGLTDTCANPEPPAEPQASQMPGGLASLLDSTSAFVDTTVRTAETIINQGLEVLNNPAHALDLAKVGLDGSTALGKVLLLSPDEPTIFKGPLGVVKRVAWSRPIPLSDIKAIGRVTGGTVNDVLVAAVGGALRRYLLSHDAMAETPSVRSVIPVNLRSPDAPITLGNRFGLVFVELPIGIDDPFERLLAFKAQMDGIKHSAEAVVTFGILNTVGMVPSLLEQPIIDMFGTKATLVLTNLPGPRQQLYMAGKPLRDIMFWVPQAGRLGLGISIMSYNGSVYIGVASDAGLIPDAQALVDGFYAEFAELLDLVHMVEVPVQF